MENIIDLKRFFRIFEIIYSEQDLLATGASNYTYKPRTKLKGLTSPTDEQKYL